MMTLVSQYSYLFLLRCEGGLPCVLRYTFLFRMSIHGFDNEIVPAIEEKMASKPKGGLNIVAL